MAFVLIAKVSIYFTNVLVKKHTHKKQLSIGPIYTKKPQLSERNKQILGLNSPISEIDYNSIFFSASL